MSETAGPTYPVRYFPSRSGGGFYNTEEELLWAAREYGTGWLEDADGRDWYVEATYSVKPCAPRG